MTLLRRLCYFVFGIAPATLWALGSIFLPIYCSVGIVLFAIGLTVATIRSFPVGAISYWALIASGVIGLLSFIPQNKIFIDQGLLLAIRRLAPRDYWYIIKTTWLMFGPALCTLHFIATARRAPNSSLGDFRSTPGA